MKSQIKVYKRNTMVFKVIIPNDDENFSVEGIMRITNDFPTSISVQFVKFEDERSNIYCIGENHSDYISLESRIGYKVIDI